MKPWRPFLSITTFDMDYTDTTKVIAAMGSGSPAAPTILAPYVTRASRYLDRLAVGLQNVSDYFKAESIANEVLTNGAIGMHGDLTVYPHKPIVNSVSALAWRFRLSDPYEDADLTRISVEQEAVVYEGALVYSEKVYVKISYNGGLGTNVASLPEDLVDLATLMAIRLYKEERTGLADSIGVAELGTMMYTKAFPVRVIETLQAYSRIAPWT